MLHAINLTREGTPDLARDISVFEIAASNSPRGAFIAGGCDDVAIRIWRLEDGEFLHKFCDYASAVTSLAINRDGKRVISSSGGFALRAWRLWSSRSQGLRPRTCVREYDLGDMLTDATVSKDGGTVVTVHNYMEIRIWKPESGLGMLVEGNCNKESESIMEYSAMRGTGRKLVQFTRMGEFCVGTLFRAN